MISSPEKVLPTPRALTAVRTPVAAPSAASAVDVLAVADDATEGAAVAAAGVVDPPIVTSPRAGAVRYTTALVTFGPAIALIVMAVVLRLLADIPVGALTRDRVQLLGGPFYSGLYSTLGLLMWGATAAVCLFAVSMLGPAQREQRNMFGFAAALTLLLLADDMLLIHEVVFPRYFGIRDEVMIGLLGATALAFLLRYRQRIFERRAAYLKATVVFFAASLAFDALVPDGAFSGHYLVEDGLKMLGIAAWSSFWMQRCAIEVRARVKCRTSA